MKRSIVVTLLLGIFLACCNQSDKERSSRASDGNRQSDDTVTEPSLTDTNPIEVGKHIALKTKAILGENLLQAIRSKGTEHALSFCSTRAIPLTDSIAVSVNASIKRVSDKNRNPINKANATELEYIHESKKVLANKQTIKPKLISTDTQHIAYYPIVTNSMCLQCHGQPEKDMTIASLSAINQLYPEDKATGYAAGELRGIWVVEMDKF